MYQIVLFSQGSHAVHTLQRLFAFGISVDDVAIVTTNDKNNEVFKDFLLFNGMDYYIYHNELEAKEFILKKVKKVDILISIANRIIIKESLIRLCRFGAVNLHPGKLPDYKGSFSIPWSLINNENEVGYTYHYMTQEIDAGNILFEKKFAIYLNDNAHTLHYKVMTDAITNLPNVINKIIAGDTGKVQLNSGNYYSNNLPYDGKIDIEWDLEKVSRFLKAMYFPPYTGALLEYKKYKQNIHTIDEYIRLIKKDN